MAAFPQIFFRATMRGGCGRSCIVSMLLCGVAAPSIRPSRIATRIMEMPVSSQLLQLHAPASRGQARLRRRAKAVGAALARHRRVVVIEEMLPNGGLAGRVKQLAWEEKAACRIDTFTLKDEFMHLYGSHEELLASHGLSAEAILAVLGRP